MNSYPPELLAQLAPVMFVTGLDTFPAQPDHGDQPSTPTSPKVNDFNQLAARLREALQVQRKVAVWQPEKAKTFQILLVDKEIKFPPRKLVPLEDSSYSAAHSPLSPLTPTSPLYPDGLIAPIWIRKHASLVPSVFVLFLRIFEFPSSSTPLSPLDPPDSNREREKEQEERRRDAELAAEVALRKKSTNERGIKLTVVLMASRKLLDDPALDARLTFIRRQSGLDSRAALFVLSPVSSSELGDFVKSLQQALYEPALEYYTAHSKRVRRKRNRHSQATSHPNPVPGTGNVTRPLRPEGWTVRYEYKMACFAEFRGEDEVALKHYQDAHSMLVVMFGSTAILPPRTKRWAEAKVLADCINLKICKLYLYNNEHALALSHHNTHVRIFSDFSRGWGIGEETFEYWSWIARQHRVLAELLEQGTRSTLKIPVHEPVAPIPSNLVASQIHNIGGKGLVASTLEVESMRSSGINPSHALQHPGFYYFMAAQCMERRRQRFLAALELEATQKSFVSSPGFVNEKKVDHWTIILELYTKAYELFKKYTVVSPQIHTQGRLTFWIAYQIAQAYYESGKYDMAIRFFERIAKTYRRENWGPLLRPLLSTWYACARELRDVELSVKLLLEMFGHDRLRNVQEPISLEDDLLAILKNTVPASDDVLVIEPSDTRPIFDSSVVFWNPEVKVGEAEAFQISMTAPDIASISSLPITSLTIYFSHREYPLILRHEDQAGRLPHSFQLIRLGHIPPSSEPSEDIVANLCWEPGGCFVFSGSVSSDSPISLEVTKLVVRIEESKWKIDILINTTDLRHGLPTSPRWLSSINPPRYLPLMRGITPFINVRHKPHTLAVALVQESPAYLNEKYPIVLDITNIDKQPLEVVVDVLLPPTEIDGATNKIIFDDETSSNFIKGVSFGVLTPGVNAVKTLYLLNTGAPGDRIIDISIQSRSTIKAAETSEPELQDVTETLKTLIVPTIDPINFIHSVTYTQSLANWPGLTDLKTFEGEHWNGSETSEASVTTTITCGGSGLLVESVALERQNHERAKILDCSTDYPEQPSEYLPGDELSHICRMAVTPSDDLELPILDTGSYCIMWRRIRNNGDHGSLSTTVIPLPALQPPADPLLALLSVPPVATLHIPISLSLTIRNSHRSRSANVFVQLEPDASDGFVVAGLRSGRISILMPGEEEKVTWKLIPIECGHIKIPHIKVTDKRSTLAGGGESPNIGTKGERVKIIDVRLTQRPTMGETQNKSDLEDGILGTVLVLP